MMSSKIHSLPPLKRFRLLQQQQSDEVSSSPLPAKKRKEPRNLNPPIPSDSGSSPTHRCLPAKKRVWALPPADADSLFDLNVEYNPSSMEKTQPQSPDRETLVSQSETLILKSESERDEQEGGIDEEEDGIVCAVCESTDGDPSDPIVICDGCDLMVHATCYGDPLVKNIPDGDWFCAVCTDSKSSSPSSSKCCLCPVSGGALKPTSHGGWAHLLCALYVPEVFFEDPIGREGINCSQVPKRRWKEVCYLCNGANGCAIECSELDCKLGFHVTCGLKEGLCIEYKEGRRSGIVAGFCKEHTKLWEKQQQTGKFKIVARDDGHK